MGKLKRNKAARTDGILAALDNFGVDKITDIKDE